MAGATQHDQDGDDTRSPTLVERLWPATEAIAHLLYPGMEPPRDDVTLIQRARLRLRALRGWGALAGVALLMSVVLGIVGSGAGAIIGGAGLVLALLFAGGCLRINRSLLIRPPRRSQPVWMTLAVVAGLPLAIAQAVAAFLQFSALSEPIVWGTDSTLGAVLLMALVFPGVFAPVSLVASLSLIAWRTMDDLNDGLAYRSLAQRLPPGPPLPPPPGVGLVAPTVVRPPVTPPRPPR